MSTDKAIYGIIGYPLTHTLSPLMHNAAFTALDVEAIYKPFPLEEEELKEFFTELRKKDSPIFGLNVTVPYKEKVIPFLDSLAPLAERIQAVNTIVISKDRKLVGYNTDAPGFMAHLLELQFDVADKNIAILGAGGSARAILTALCLVPERPQAIKIYNRTNSRLENLLVDLKTRVNVDIVEVVSNIEDLNIELADLLINTTSVGLRRDDEPLVDVDLFHPHMLVYDLIYNPLETSLLKRAKAKGARTVNGLGMLYYQGVLAFQHWADTQIDESVKLIMREALERGARQ